MSELSYLEKLLDGVAIGGSLSLKKRQSYVKGIFN